MLRRRGLVRPLALLLLVGVVASCGEDEAARDDDGAIADSGEVGVLSIEVGDCFDDPPGIDEEERVEFDAVSAVPCDEPHDNEAYHLFDLPDGDFPGTDELESLGAEGCLEPFEEFVGLAYEESELEIFPLTPTQASWEDADDREVICAVYLPGEELTGSMEGSAR